MKNNCPHYDYGKSADKALGAYCTLKKICVEPEDCEKCENKAKEYAESTKEMLNSFFNCMKSKYK
jgi:hypothetical protein